MRLGEWKDGKRERERWGGEKFTKYEKKVIELLCVCACICVCEREKEDNSEMRRNSQRKLVREKDKE